jgi:hypothetical protein
MYGIIDSLSIDEIEKERFAFLLTLDEIWI